MTAAPQPINGAIAAHTEQHHYAIRLVRIDLTASPAVEVELPAGALIVHAYVAIERDGIVLARPGEQPTVRLVPMLVVLVDPRVTTKTRRRFVALPVGQGIASDEELELMAVVTTPDGSGVLALLEEKIGAPA